MKLWILFMIFFKASVLSFGGGYAMISMLNDELVKNKIINSKDFFDIVAVSQIAPGPIASNLAVFVGYKKYKYIGGLISLLGVCCPSVIIAILFLSLIKKVKNRWFGEIINGLKIASVCLIFLVFIRFFLKMMFIRRDRNFLRLLELVDKKRILLSIIAFVFLYRFKRVNILIWILIFSLVGIVFL